MNPNMLEFTVLTQSDQASSHVELNRLIRFVVFKEININKNWIINE